LGTLHATYPRDTLTRLETMAMMSDVELPLAALRLQIASGVNVIVQVSRLSDGSRKVTHVTEVAGFDLASGRYELHDIFSRQYYGQDSHGRIQSDLLPTGYLPSFVSLLRDHGKDLPGAVYDAVERRDASVATPQVES
jgi:pilus assembly protein CpaF